MRNITIVLGSLTGGGTERVAVNMINYWLSEERTVNVITKHGREKDHYSLPNSVQRIVLGDPGDSANRWVGLFRNIDRIRRLRKTIKKNGYSVVISFLARNNVLTILACIGLGKHVVISERNDPGKQKQRWPWGWLRNLLYKHADVITANSKSAIEHMKGYVPESKLIIVPNPVIIPEEQAQPDHSTVILNVGRLVPQKAQSLLLDAWSRISEEYPDWTLEILGEGEERKKLTDKIREIGLSDRTTLRGFVDHPSRYYHSAGIFVLPSYFEGTPNALLEAMAHGLPCVVSDSLPGVLEIMEDRKTGLFFTSGEAEDLSDKLKELMEDSELRLKLGNGARKKMYDYTPEKVADAWEEAMAEATA